MDVENKEWEEYGLGVFRMKVEGGHLYSVSSPAGIAITHVPDVDLTRYSAHLRDAYTKGYQDGQAHANVDCDVNLATP